MVLPPSDATQPLMPSHPPDFHQNVQRHLKAITSSLKELKGHIETKSEVDVTRILHDLGVDAENLQILMQEYPKGFEPKLKRAVNEHISALSHLVDKGAPTLTYGKKSHNGAQELSQAQSTAETVLKLVK